jgi:hypothetical protein
VVKFHSLAEQGLESKMECPCATVTPGADMHERRVALHAARRAYQSSAAAFRLHKAFSTSDSSAQLPTATAPSSYHITSQYSNMLVRRWSFGLSSFVYVAVGLGLWILFLRTTRRFGDLSLDSDHRYIGASEIIQDHLRGKRRLHVVKAGGIPKEGLGSSLGFITASANIAHLLDADLIISQTAEMMGYRASEILNIGLELRGGGRVCDIMEVLLEDPSTGTFQGRMDRAQSILDVTYERAEEKCRNTPTEDLLSEYALEEISRCDVLVINDYRTISRGWTSCSMAWWASVIDQYAGEPHGNDIAIHFRWGDMFEVSQIEDKWRFDMTKVARVVDIIREENPTVTVNVFMKKSRQNESQQQMRQLLSPLDGEFNIVEADNDVEELAMMAKARYLIINSGSFSTAAAARAWADVVIYNEGGARHSLQDMGLKHVFGYDHYEEDQLRQAIRHP